MVDIKDYGRLLILLYFAYISLSMLTERNLWENRLLFFHSQVSSHYKNFPISTKSIGINGESFLNTIGTTGVLISFAGMYGYTKPIIYLLLFSLAAGVLSLIPVQNLHYKDFNTEVFDVLKLIGTHATLLLLV